jgi:UDP-N-acetylglucosamine 2-epimerase
MKSICRALREIVTRLLDVGVLMPVHLNPRVQQVVYPLLSGVERV